jgi:hypothetical protein
VAGLLIVAVSSCAYAQDIPKLPGDCAAHPTADCLVDAVITAASPKEADTLIGGVAPLVKHNRKNLAKRLLLRAEELLSGSTNQFDLRTIAEAWHNLGDDKAAEKDLERAADAINPVADLKLRPPSPGMPKPLPSASDFWMIANDQAKWGLTKQAKATLARMRAIPMLNADAAADQEVRAWNNGKRLDLAVAAAEAVPKEKDRLISNIFIPGCYPTNELAACATTAAKIGGAWTSAAAYASLAGRAARDQPEQAKGILETGIEAFAKATDDSWMHRGFARDPVVLLAGAWLDFDDPARALGTLDLRATRPDLFPATITLPIDDYVLRAELLVRLGRIDEALKTAEAATANFSARPTNNLERFRATFHAVSGGPQGGPFDRTLRTFNDGDRAYQAILDTLADMGKPDEVKAVAARFPTPANPDEVDLAVMRADLSAKRWTDALAILRTPAAKSSAGRTATALAHAGQDELAVEAAALQLYAGSTIDISALLDVADVQMKAGRKAAARTTLGRIDPSEIDIRRGESDLGKLALARATLGDIDGAWTVLNRIPNPSFDYYRNAVITAQALAGDRTDALAHAMTAPYIAGWIAAMLAVAAGS